MPVGPDPDEHARYRDTAESLAFWEPAVRWIVVVDDAPAPRSFPELAGVEMIRLDHPIGAGAAAGVEDRVAAATLAGFAWAARHTDADFVMKIDTDALVIAPFAAKLQRAAAADGVGLIGSYDRTSAGEPRSFDPWVELIGRAARRRALIGRGRKVRRIIRQARRAGYVEGEHALGCAVAMPRAAVDAIQRGGGFDDPALFVGTALFDDPILGLLVRRAGFRLVGDVDPGGTFAVAWRGLPDRPQRLLEHGYSIIHSVKNDAQETEDGIRSFFAAERTAADRPR